MRRQARQSLDLNWASVFWVAGALCLILFAGVLTALSPRFGYDWDVIDMPVPTLVALLLSAGIIYFAGVGLASRCPFSTPLGNERIAIAVMVAAGLCARLILFASEPALEDDYQRYFWDGAVTANGFNPYTTPPEDVIDAGAGHPLSSIARASGPVLERINHPHLTTIYPPLAQAAFAIAYAIKPFSMAAWRSVVLVSDTVTLALIIVLLGTLGKSTLWSAVYWWNPIVLKEFYNSAHMDALILPFVLGALYLALKMRPLSATTALACAVGTKVWPVLLLPLVWRRTIQNRMQILVCGGVFVLFCVVWAVPYLLAGLGENSGLVVYAERWTNTSPAFMSLRAFFAFLFSGASDPHTTGSYIARFTVLSIAAALALFLAAKPIKNGEDFVTRALVVVAAVILLSPAVYPWYTVWMLPLLALIPYLGLLLVSVTIPLYYSFYYFAARDSTDVYQTVIVWIIWVPVWLWCARTLLTKFLSSRLQMNTQARNVECDMDRP